MIRATAQASTQSPAPRPVHRPPMVARLSAVLRVGGLLMGLWAPHAVMAQGSTKPDLLKGQQIAAQVCAACHGADGNASSPSNPKLAGQHPDYLYKQLTQFAPGPGGAAPERANAVMAGFAAMLSDADRRHVAAYFGAQKLKPASAQDAALVELGQKIYRAGIPDKNVPACAGCHGPAGAGMPSAYPVLRGQWADYTAAQLTQFRAGQRRNHAPMMAIAARLSDQEIKAVAEYVAGLR